MIPLAVILVYFALLLAIGYAANRVFRGTAEDFLVASHSIGPVLLFLSVFGASMTAFAMVGSTGRAYTLGVGVYGLLASASGIMHSLCFFLIAVPLWTLGKRHGYTTQIQFFRERLGNPWIGYLLFPFVVGLVISYLLVGVVGSGAVVNSVTAGTFAGLGWFPHSNHGVPVHLASAVVCGVVLSYVFFGGIRGTAWANAFQTVVFLSVGIFTFVVIARALGGTDDFLENLRRASQAVGDVQRSRARIPKPLFFSFLLIPLSVAMFPHVFQHWLTARSAKAFKLTIVMQPIFIMVVWLPCVMLGAWASAPTSGVPAGTPENEVLATLVQRYAGPLLSGLLAAAIMASLDSQFLCVGTMFTEDIVLHAAGANRFSDHQVLVMARLFIVSIVLVTYVLSLFPRAVFDLGLWSFSGFTGLFPLVCAAIYWRRLTATGAISSVVVTFVLWGVFFYRSGWGQNARYVFPESPLVLTSQLAIPPLLPVVTILAASTLTLVGVSLLTRPPAAATLAKFFRD